MSKKIIVNPSAFKDGSYILSYIFEIRIDLDADILEGLSRNVSNLRKKLFSNDIDNEDILEYIYNYETSTQILEIALLINRGLSHLFSNPTRFLK